MLDLSPETQEQSFDVLKSIIEYIDFSEILPFVNDIWVDIFTCMISEPTDKYLKSLVVFMSLFVVKHGEADVVCSLNKFDQNMFPTILEDIWTPFMIKITRPKEMKLVVVATTKLITETPWLLEPSSSIHWGKLLDNIITLVSQLEKESVVEEPESPEILQNEADPLREITDPKKFVVDSLGRLSSGSPGIYPQIIVEHVEEGNQKTLLQLCDVYNRRIV
ncbi:Exportin-2 [Cardamine amara subsp. amara]|uniref:Exportin-2 n=1 Tax=Cardamine amara subsp. amara TaxID=228776 RepID=A0ABD1BL36_CARAN